MRVNSPANAEVVSCIREDCPAWPPNEGNRHLWAMVRSEFYPNNDVKHFHSGQSKEFRLVSPDEQAEVQKRCAVLVRIVSALVEDTVKNPDMERRLHRSAHNKMMSPEKLASGRIMEIREVIYNGIKRTF